MTPHESTATSQPPTDNVEQRKFTTLLRVRNFTTAFLLLLFLYVGSYFATAFAVGAGWMEVKTRQRIVWTVHWPISKCTVNESPAGPKYINDANGWFFNVGWQNLHE